MFSVFNVVGDKLRTREITNKGLKENWRIRSLMDLNIKLSQELDDVNEYLATKLTIIRSISLTPPFDILKSRIGCINCARFVLSCATFFIICAPPFLDSKKGTVRRMVTTGSRFWIRNWINQLCSVCAELCFTF